MGGILCTWAWVFFFFWGYNIYIRGFPCFWKAGSLQKSNRAGEWIGGGRGEKKRHFFQGLKFVYVVVERKRGGIWRFFVDMDRNALMLVPPLNEEEIPELEVLYILWEEQKI